MQNLPIAVGDCVRVRRERWRVVSVRQHDHCRLLALQGIGTGNRNIEKRVLLPFDLAEPLNSRRRLRFVGSRRWQQQCRRLIASHGGADALRSARTARIDLLPHQLEPALAMVRGLTSRILIADDVGLGKTIQAGLIVAELILRAAAQRVLILTPAGLREQWIGELNDRFSLAFSLVDTPAIQQRRAMLQPDINPWSTFPMVVASLDYIKRPEVLPGLEGCRWDLVIVDEAHGAVAASDRHEAASRLAARAAYVLLLTATPHNGDAGAFASLRAIGGHLDTLLIFRRTRHDVGMPADRRVRRLAVTPSDAEREMHARLERFSEAVLADHSDRGADISLALATIHKRALSSAFALHETIRRRLLSLDDGGAPSEQQLTLPLDGEPGEFAEDDAAPRWICPPLRDPAAERTLLTAVAEAARAAFATQAKLRALHRLIRRIGEPMVIFTEYRDTLLHIRDRVFPNAAVMHGGMSRAEKRQALDAFTRGDRTVLMATDAASEGLNLQRTCRVVINFELPWNPLRLEQRIGRVDRIGQKRRVHALHLIAAGTREQPMVERLQRRLAIARTDIGAPDPLGAFTERGEASATTVRVDASLEFRRLVEARRLTAMRPSPLAETRSDRFEQDREPTATGSNVLLRNGPPHHPDVGRTLSGPPEPEAAPFLGCGGEMASRESLISNSLSRTRARTGSRPLAIVRAALVGDSGQVIAQEIRGLLIPPNRRLRRGIKPEMLLMIEVIEKFLADHCASAADSSAEAAASVHTAFWTRRIEREHSIWRAISTQWRPPRQPGLFWKHSSEATSGTLTDPSPAEEAAASVQSAERSRLVTSLPAVVALLLVS